MQPAFDSSSVRGEVEILINGRSVKVPEERGSLHKIHSFLERLAVDQQRSLWSDILGSSAGEKQAHASSNPNPDLTRVSLELVRLALAQTGDARVRLNCAVELVLINEGSVARELWRKLARELHQPLITISFLAHQANIQPDGCASLARIREWQVQQLLTIIQEVEEACWSENPCVLANALESRVSPWLESLRSSFELWHETLMAGYSASRA